MEPVPAEPREQAAAADGAVELRLQQILAAVVQASEDAIFTVDDDDRVTTWNPTAERLLGVAAADALGRPRRDLLPAEQRAQADSGFRRVMAGETLYGPEWDWRRPDGSTVLVLPTVLPVRSALGEVVGAAAVIRDLGPERAAEARRKELERQIEQVQWLDSLGQLAGGLGHDFNNLLAAINLTAEMLAGSLPEGSDERAAAARIVEITGRAAALTARLMVFARNDEPARRRVDLNEVARQADGLLSRTLGEQVERRLELAAEPCVVEGDPAQLEQVVLNLAVNARDAMPTGGTLLVETALVELGDDDHQLYRTRAPGPHVVLTVSDQGVGMDEQTRRRAFDPFFTTKGRGHGTGLGLAAVYGVASQAGGGAWIYSEPGRGTVVKVAFPRLADRSETPPGAPPAPAVPGQGERILVVEDEPALRDVARRLLERAGYLVDVFPDGTTLLAALPTLSEAASAPVLLLTDVVLPGPAGPEVAERARLVLPGLRVVFMSGYTAGLMGDRPADAEVLAKPFSSQTLVAAVQRALSGGG